MTAGRRFERAARDGGIDVVRASGEPLCPHPLKKVVEMSDLAIFGGAPVITQPPPYASIGDLETSNVLEVLQSGCLSGFYGSWCDEFFGGPKIQALEAAWRDRFGTKHAVTVNSAASGLVAAMAAVGVSPGDEVIVPPFTMSASVVAPLTFGGIPVFVDIEPDTFCLDVDAVAAQITPRTRAVLVVNLFGHPARLRELRALCDRHGVFLVEDNAQAPLATEDGVLAGAIGHIGVFSLNYHKHIHSGEGGVCVTNDDALAKKLQLVRNHGENCVTDLGVQDLTNMVGYNLRMTEMSAAVALAQLARAEAHIDPRAALGDRLTAELSDLEGVVPSVTRAGCRHVYYLWTMKLDIDALGVSRSVFARALAAEGLGLGEGYVSPLYRLPLFQHRRAIGRDGWPFTLTDRDYKDGLCPVTERLYERELLVYETCAFELSERYVDQIIECVRKVHAQRHALARQHM